MAVTQKEIDQIKARLRRAEQREKDAIPNAKDRAYARKSSRKKRKNKSKAAKRDIFSHGRWLPGSGFSNEGSS